MSDTNFVSGTVVRHEWLNDVNRVIYHANFNLSSTASAITGLQKFAQLPAVDDYGALGDGVTDDTEAIQTAINQNNEVRLIPGKTYIVSPQILTTPEGGVGICLNMKSNFRFVMWGATIKQLSGTGGSGAVIGNTISLTNCIIDGGTVDGNKVNTTGNMCTVVLWNTIDCVLDNVTTKNNRFVAQGFRATATGYGRNRIFKAYIPDSLGIGIGCNRQDEGLEIASPVVVNTINNAIDVEGNNPSGNSFGSKILITNFRIFSCSVGIFLESVGNAVIGDGFIDNFSSYAVVMNRINSGSLDVVINGVQIRNGSGRPGILIQNNSGRVVIDNMLFDTMDCAINFSGTASNVVIGTSIQYRNIAKQIIKVDQGTNQLINSRIRSPNVVGSKTSGKPFTISPLNNINNFPNRTLNLIVEPSFYMDESTTIASVTDDEYKTGVVGTLSTNGSWSGAYSIYVSGETQIHTPSIMLTVGRYVTVNAILYLIYASTVPYEYTIRSALGVAGDFTSNTNAARTFVEYWPEYQTT